MKNGQQDGGEGAPLPGWVPETARLYLAHTGDGVSLRELARQRGVHASTVMRQVRRYESRRDDVLVDQALDGLKAVSDPDAATQAGTGPDRPVPRAGAVPQEAELSREARRVLGRMAETSAVLAVSADLGTAVVLRQGGEGKTQRLCTVERSVAQAFALKDWITCDKPGRVSVYRLTVAGRAALRRMAAAQSDGGYGAQHRQMEMREIDEAGGPQRIRVNVAESPIVMLGRKRDKDGKPYLEGELIRVAERLREDFELAQMGPRVAQNWDRFLTAGDRGGFRSDSGLAEGPRAARERVLLALADLGPGLGDVVLRVCCFVEGIETTERHMGWAARSGKIVLRIALQRLKRHYEERYGRSGPLFG
ncbi:DUF6456 domain-containing protein [Paragemmobacter straminiformis]|uniref:Helix-turn-helix domain-containing protein n=1 Tax=Paragemmobacter straminiformis TaxID=2045119 RepID=A0A842I7W2_9RHOB|nr:DUF6456 domain-containing protein [Gemmobacter straminiformis]MBC2835483.1 helix-turn-helix domain-containing protein [Gemmobacter straminiformis]